MNEDEHRQLKVTWDRIAEHQQRLTAIAVEVEDPFSPVRTGLLELLATAKKRIGDRLGEQGPPLNE